MRVCVSDHVLNLGRTVSMFGIEKTRSCRVENNTKTEYSGFLSQASMGLILVVTQLF